MRVIANRQIQSIGKVAGPISWCWCIRSFRCAMVITHDGSHKALLGEEATSKLIDSHSNELHATAQTPPAFIVHSVPDDAVKVENSRLFHQGLQSQGV